MNWMSSLFKKIEATESGFSSWLAAFAGLILVKIILENLANGTFSGMFVTDVFTMLHYVLWFFGLYMSLVLIVHALSGHEVLKVTKVIFFAFIVIWLPPVIDFFAYHGQVHRLSYIYLGPKELILNFLAFGSQYGGVGIGQMVTVPILSVVLAAYVYSITKSYYKSFLVIILAYAAVYIWGASPSVIKIVYDLAQGTWSNFSANDLLHFYSSAVGQSVLPGNLPAADSEANTLQRLQVAGFSQIFFLVDAVLLGVWAYVVNRAHFLAVMGNVRLFGIIHYYIHLLVGLMLAVASPLVEFNWVTILSLAVLFLSYYFAYMFAMGTNDIADINIDRVSNQSRPLVKKVLEVADISNYNLAFLLLGLVGATLVGPIAFFCVLVAVGASLVYSTPPLRLKSVPLLATFLIAIATLSAQLAGFFAVNFSKAISSFPQAMVLAVLVFFTLWTNFKDVKDREGDAADGITTFSNWLNEKSSLRLVALLTGLGYLSVPIFLNQYSLVFISVLAFALNYWLIIRKPYSHYSVFAVYVLFLVLAMFFLQTPLVPRVS